MTYNSTIISKKKQLKCGCFDYAFSKGKCKMHATIDSTKKRIALAKDTSKVKKLGVENLHHQYKNPIAEDSQSLMDWFTDRMRDCEPQCENCKIVASYLKETFWKKQWKSCQAHLFAKRHFKSIATHPLNGMVLGSGYSGMCHCHDKYDSNWDNASKMKIWPEVVRRFKILYPLMKPEEHQFIPAILLEYIKTEQ